MEQARVMQALTALLNELVNGAPPTVAWMLNPEDPGLLRSLEKLSAEQASVVPPQGGSSIAAHVDHLSYGFSLLNRWNAGEENPFADADYKASWNRTTVTQEEWIARLEEFRRQTQQWREALARPRELSDFELTGVLSSISHLAYHVGAIRQIDRSARGPAASD